MYFLLELIQPCEVGGICLEENAVQRNACRALTESASAPKGPLKGHNQQTGRVEQQSALGAVSTPGTSSDYLHSPFLCQLGY